MAFKAELAGYRGRISATMPDDKTRALVFEILDRWKDHPETETAWQTLQEAFAPMPPADRFIAEVLRSRLECARLKSLIEKSPAVESKLRAQANRHWRDKDLFEANFKLLKAEAFSSEKTGC
jgi:hypothetical protein